MPNKITFRRLFFPTVEIFLRLTESMIKIMIPAMKKRIPAYRILEKTSAVIPKNSYPNLIMGKALPKRILQNMAAKTALAGNFVMHFTPLFIRSQLVQAPTHAQTMSYINVNSTKPVR